MTLTVELSDEIANGLKSLSEKDLIFYREGLRQHATDEAQKLAAMTQEERDEYEDVCTAISESIAQFERGEYMTLNEAKERSRRDIDAGRAQDVQTQ
ncbi:MAG: hypothetical protein H7145_18530 [Akkermansiaceae bacterium]|nr:hypothetical protein [Armatimonadota bacterium]